MIRAFGVLCDEHTVEQIAGALRMQPRHVHELEQHALAKMRIGLAILELIGRADGELVLVGLRGRELSAWRGALVEARSRARGGRT